MPVHPADPLPARPHAWPTTAAHVHPPHHQPIHPHHQPIHRNEAKEHR